jgi:hypothetical protein
MDRFQDGNGRLTRNVKTAASATKASAWKPVVVTWAATRVMLCRA